MKTRNHYYIVLVLVIGLFSCSKELLNTLPNDRVSENIFWKTQSDAGVAVNALYRDLDSTNIFSWEAFTDVAHVKLPFVPEAFVTLGTYDASSSKILSEWSNAYSGIAAANYFLANADKIPVITDSATFNRYKAEARFLRAYQYVKLTGLYGGVPLVTAPLSVADARLLKRETVDKIYDFIDAELTAVAPVLPLSYTSTNIGRATRGAAYALKSRLDLYAGRYTDAAAAAKAVIDSRVYSLYPNYSKLFSYAAEGNSEVVLDKQYIASVYPNNVFSLLAPYSQKSSSNAYVPTKAGVDQYQTASGMNITDAGSGYDPNNPYTNRDPRLGYSVFLNGDILPDGTTYSPSPNSGTPDAVGNGYSASTTGFCIRKYINKEDFANPTNCGINIILLRYAEVLLNYAEAKIEAGAIDQSVYDAINTIRNKRSDVVLPSLLPNLSQAQLRVAVRQERVSELAFEGLHLQDIRRWKTAATVVPGPVFGITYTENGTVKIIQTTAIRAFDPARHYLWPIPQTERDQDISLVQNPGW